MSALIFGAGVLGFGLIKYLTSDPVASLKTQAKEFFESHDPALKPDLSKVKMDKDDTASSIAKKLLKDHKGFIIGEYHSESASHFFLLDAMDNKEVTVICREYLDEFQKEFDDYTSGKTDEIPPGWKKKKEKTKSGIRKGEIEVIEKARKNKQRILCLDSSLCKTDLGDILCLYNRVSTMNYLSIKKITSSLEKEKGKFIALVGDLHANTHDKPAVPGIGPMLGVPSVSIRDDSTSPKQPSFTLNKITINKPAEDGGHPDVAILAAPVAPKESVLERRLFI